MKTPLNRKQKGFTFIELLAGLVVIGIGYATIGGISEGVGDNGRIVQATLETNAMRSGASMFAAPADFENMTIEDLIVGDKIGDGLGTNPWRGDYIITPLDPWDTYTIEVTDVSDEALGRISAIMGRGATGTPVTDGNDVTATYAQ